METQNEMELDLLGLLFHLKSKIWIVLLATVVFALGGYIGSKYLIEPVYTASTQVYVYQRNEGGMDTGNLSVATQVGRDCAVIISSESVTTEVVERLGLRMSPKALSSAIQVDSQDNTRVLKLSYTGTDPAQAVEIINTVREVAAVQVKNLMEMDVLKTLCEASIHSTQSSMNVRRHTFIGGAVGCALALIILVAIFLLDDSIRTEDDVERYLGLSTLASIPVSSELRVSRGSNTRSGKRSRRTGR